MMDYYDQHLLSAVVTDCVEKNYEMRVTKGHVLIRDSDGNDIAWCASGTVSAALPHLAADLGVTVPERPSAERVEIERVFLSADDRRGWVSLKGLRDLYAREPLTVLALLEGGAS